MYKTICVTVVQVYVNGDYILEVRTHSYNNPTNRCAGCRMGLNDAGCCDDFSVFECTGDLRCDNYFYYCLRTLWSVGFVCDGGQVSRSEPDGKTINFSQDMVLGLANPLPLNGISDAWNVSCIYRECGSPTSFLCMDFILCIYCMVHQSHSIACVN